MLRLTWMTSPAAAKDYFAKTDSFASCPGDWLGKGAEMLGLVGTVSPMHFHSLADNLDPRTGKTLRPHAKDGDRVGMDFTFNSTKSVGIARELAGIDNAGDPRIEDAHREAVSYTVGMIESDMQTRVKGGREGDRVTGNLVAYRVTHRDTRINADDQRPDMSLHDHVFVFNTTFDPIDGKWKACQMGEIKHDAPFYESLYHNRLASNLRNLGYGIRREGKAFEIAGIDRPLIEKFSRRTKYIEGVAAKLGITKPESKAKLGATTRLGKTKEPADNLNGYYVSRLTNQEREQLSHLEYQPSYVSDAQKAVAFAISHTFERQSVTEERKLYETAIRHGIGSVTPEGVIEESKRQGALLKGGQVTTKAVLAEESRIIDFAREGKGTMRPLSVAVKHTTDEHQTQRATSPALGQQKGHFDESKQPDGVGPRSPVIPPLGRLHATSAKDVSATASSGVSAGLDASVSARLGSPRSVVSANTATLSLEQQALVSHVLESSDQLILNIGDAGTGKTHAIKSAFAQINCPVEMLAPSADASRGVLRKEGFGKADTVASFLLSPDRQAAVKNGVIWVDEAGLLPIRDLSRLTDIAKQQNARLVLQGDPKQHRSVVRHGNMMNVLQEYAGLPVGRLTEIWRQKHKGYKRIVSDIAAGDRAGALDGLKHLGWVQQTASNAPLVEEYVSGLNAGKEMLVVSPTHAEANEVTTAIRKRLQDDGKLGTEERLFEQLVPLNWTEAERDDRERYDGTEVLCFHRNSGTFRAGQKIAYSELKPDDRWSSAAHFSVHRKEEIGITAGDLIRFTANGSTTDKKHKLDNGRVYRVKGFDKHDNLVLDNGWTVGNKFGHLSYGYVSTSHASQGKTVDRVLIAMGSESRGAIGAEQFYVSVSRGRESAKVFSDMSPEELKAAIQRTDTRKSATELMHPKKPKSRRRKFLERMKEGYEKLRERVTSAIREPKQREKEHSHER